MLICFNWPWLGLGLIVMVLNLDLEKKWGPVLEFKAQEEGKFLLETLASAQFCKF
jgi:hypothetical protein